MKKQTLVIILLAVFVVNCIMLTACTKDPLVYELQGDGTYAVVGFEGDVEDVNIPSTYNGAPVTCIGYEAFAYCHTLESITIPNGVTTIEEGAFFDCYSLTSIVIPSTVVAIGDEAFGGCKGFTTITIPSSVTSIGLGAFEYCKNLQSITVPFVGATLNGTLNAHFGYIFGASSLSENDDRVPASLKTVVVTGGTGVGENAFGGCSNIETVIIQNGVTSIGPGAFNYCTSLASITISSSVTSIEQWAFSGCKNLSNATFEDPNGWYVTFWAGSTTETLLDLSDTLQNATYLKDTYDFHCWEKRN